jgi:hypothetical protein
MKSIIQTSTNVSLGKRQVQDKHFVAQIKRMFEAFYNSPKTIINVVLESKMVSYIVDPNTLLQVFNCFQAIIY